MPRRYSNLCQFAEVRSSEIWESRTFESTEFDNCVIGFGSPSEPVPRFTSCVVRNCKFSRCGVLGADLVDCTFENVDALSTGALWLFCATFRRVWLRGSINNMFLRLIAPILLTDAERKRRWTERIAAHYASQADWALDVSEARLGDVWLDGVPADRIIRRPGRDGILSRERAHSLLQRKRLSDLQFGPLVGVAQQLVDGPFERVVVPGTDSSKPSLRQLHAVEAWAAAGYLEL
jgi:hypothetical protein